MIRTNAPVILACIAISSINAATAIASPLSAWSKLTIDGEDAYKRHWTEPAELPVAETKFRAATQIARNEKGSRLRLVNSLLWMGYVLEATRNFKEAEQCLLEALKLQAAKPEGPLDWKIKGKLTMVYMGDKQWAKAEALLYELLRTRGQIMGARGGEYWMQLRMLAGVQRDEQKLEQSEKTAKEALAIAVNMHNQGQIEMSLVELGKTERELHKFQTAEDSFFKALAIEQTVEDKHGCCDACLELAETFKQERKVSRANQYLKLALKYNQQALKSRPDDKWIQNLIEEKLSALKKLTAENSP